jgi:hypothetical protein
VSEDDRTDYQTALDALQISQRSAAHLLRRDERTSRRWAAGDLAPPHDVMLVLMLMYHHGLTPEKVDDIEERVSRKWFKKRKR